VSVNANLESVTRKPQNAKDIFMERVLVNIPSNPLFERVVRASADEVGQVIGLAPERIKTSSWQSAKPSTTRSSMATAARRPSSSKLFFRSIRKSSRSVFAMKARAQSESISLGAL
jgi:hypothetical protein